MEIVDKVNYDKFDDVLKNTFNRHAPEKKVTVRANHKPYVTKEMRKAIMHRSYLQNKVFKYGLQADKEEFNKHKNYCNRLSKRERKNFYAQLDTNNITDNKKFWKTVGPLFSDKGGIRDKIILVEKGELISEDLEVAETFNKFFSGTLDDLKLMRTNCY